MALVPFCAQTDGFSFNNSWTMEPQEMAVMGDIMIDIFENADDELQIFFETAARGAGATLVGVGPLAGLAAGTAVRTGAGVLLGSGAGAALGGVVGLGIGAVLTFFGLWAATDPKSLAKKALGEIIKAVPTAGFCGGMTAACLDYYKSELVLPRGNGDQPRTIGTSNAQEVWLRTYIFSRLRDSLKRNGSRFLNISALYNFRALKDNVLPLMHDIAQLACEKIMDEIDQNRPCGLGLVTTSLDPTKSHQIVCYGYEKRQGNLLELLVYDNNYPDRECVIQVRFGSGSVTINHPDAYLRRDGKSLHRRDGKQNPSYCTLIYLDYAAMTPNTALYADGFSLQPPTIALGTTLTTEITLRNRGFGAVDAGILRLQPGATDGSNFDAIETNGVRTVAVPHTFAQAGLQRCRPTIVQVTEDPTMSVVHFLRQFGLDDALSLLMIPYVNDVTIAQTNAQLSSMTRSVTPLPTARRRKRLTTLSGVTLESTVNVVDYQLLIESGDIGDRCDPQAYPGKRINVSIGTESVVPDEAPARLLWTIAYGDGPHPLQTIDGVQASIAVTLPQKVGSVVRIGLIATYPALTLNAALEITVNTEADNERAGQICELERRAAEIAHTVRTPPKGREAGWVFERGLAEHTRIDRVAALQLQEARRAADAIRRQAPR